MSLKLTEILEPFTGQGDVVEWLKKVKLVVKLQKIGELNCVIPLLLRGNAFSVFDQLPEASKANAEEIEEALISAFSMGRFTAYGVFISRKFISTEPVDVFLSDLRRLAGLAKIACEETILNAFVCGFDAHISCQLRIFHQKNKGSILDLAEQARVLVSEMNESSACVANPVNVIGNSGQRKSQCEKCNKLDHTASGSNESSACAVKPANIIGSSGQRTRQCEKCGKLGHTARFCYQNSENFARVRCYNCHEEGHIARNCKRVRCQLCGKFGHSANKCSGNE